MIANQTIVFRILLVEDNPTDAFLLKSALSKAPDWKCELIVVQRLHDENSIFEEHSLDAVITDLNLPDSIGEETVRGLAKMADGLPIIALTGWEDPIFGARLIEAGAACYWSKDRIRDPELRNTIVELVRRNGNEH